MPRFLTDERALERGTAGRVTDHVARPRPARRQRKRAHVDHESLLVSPRSKWLQARPTHPEDVEQVVRTSILSADLARLPEERRLPLAAAVAARVRLPLDYVRLNVSAVRA
jgi:hypothetical protein